MTQLSSHVKINLVTSQTLRLDAPLVALYVRHFHNSGHGHVLHSIRGQRTLCHTGICIPTSHCSWMNPS